MKITPKIISIPPYISTSWQHVASIQMQNNFLVITLNSGAVVNIPNLPPESIEKVFAAHTAFLEKTDTAALPHDSLANELEALSGADANNALRFGINLGDGVGTVMQHNPAMANAPDLPPEILERITAIAKAVAPDDVNILPKPEPQCNCIYCQLARAVRSSLGDPIAMESQTEEKEPEEEIVSDQELTFCQWDIIQTGEKLYTVVNRLDSKEKYSVYLGHPVGCTCGKQGCDHVLAVLRH